MNNARRLWYALGLLADFVIDLVAAGREQFSLPAPETGKDVLDHEPANGRRLPAAKKIG